MTFLYRDSQETTYNVTNEPAGDSYYATISLEKISADGQRFYQLSKTILDAIQSPHIKDCQYRLGIQYKGISDLHPDSELEKGLITLYRFCSNYVSEKIIADVRFDNTLFIKSQNQKQYILSWLDASAADKKNLFLQSQPHDGNGKLNDYLESKLTLVIGRINAGITSEAVAKLNANKCLDLTKNIMASLGGDGFENLSLENMNGTLSLIAKADREILGPVNTMFRDGTYEQTYVYDDSHEGQCRFQKVEISFLELGKPEPEKKTIFIDECEKLMALYNAELERKINSKNARQNYVPPRDGYVELYGRACYLAIP
jgi:hypothetical protein